MRSRQEKLQALAVNQAASGMMIVTNGEPFVEALDKKITELKEVVGAGVDIHIDDLLAQMENIKALQPSLDALKQAIGDLQGSLSNIPPSINLGGLDGVQKAIKELHIPDAKVQVEVLGEQKYIAILDALGSLHKVLKETVYTGKQSPDAFIPVRRVRNIGSKLVFDDTYWNSGGGGAGDSAYRTMLFQPITQAVAGTTTIVGAVANKSIVVTNYTAVMGAEGTLKFTSDNTAITGTMVIIASAGVSANGTEANPQLKTGVGEAFKIVTTGGAANGHITYYLE